MDTPTLYGIGRGALGTPQFEMLGLEFITESKKEAEASLKALNTATSVPYTLVQFTADAEKIPTEAVLVTPTGDYWCSTPSGHLYCTDKQSEAPLKGYTIVQKAHTLIKYHGATILEKDPGSPAFYTDPDGGLHFFPGGVPEGATPMFVDAEQDVWFVTNPGTPGEKWFCPSAEISAPETVHELIEGYGQSSLFKNAPPLFSVKFSEGNYKLSVLEVPEGAVIQDADGDFWCITSLLNPELVCTLNPSKKIEKWGDTVKQQALAVLKKYGGQLLPPNGDNAVIYKDPNGDLHYFAGGTSDDFIPIMLDDDGDLWGVIGYLKSSMVWVCPEHNLTESYSLGELMEEYGYEEIFVNDAPLPSIVQTPDGKGYVLETASGF